MPDNHRVSANLETMHDNRDGTATVTVYLREAHLYRQWVFHDPYAFAIQIRACGGRTDRDISWEQEEKEWLSSLEPNRHKSGISSMRKNSRSTSGIREGVMLRGLRPLPGDALASKH
jgi:hypothetical protein